MTVLNSDRRTEKGLRPGRPGRRPFLCRLLVKGEKTITSRTSCGPRDQGVSSSTSARDLAAS
ncbi:hypothetical protein GCM10010250_50820 [Streptomyces althioticus]|nr:hypothetical protein GCM10010250_50820 [Streptomyces althioticus]